MDKTEPDQLKKEAATKAAMMVESGSVLGVGNRGPQTAFPPWMAARPTPPTTD